MPCSRQPLSTTTALSFSGVSTRLMGRLPRSTASPAGSSRTPVGSGEVKSGFLWADTDVHSSAESERTSLQIRSENITGVPHRVGTKKWPIADVPASIRLELTYLTGSDHYAIPLFLIVSIGKKPDEAGCRANDGYRTTSAHSMRFTRLANLPTVIAARITGNFDVMRWVKVADHSSGIAGLRDTRQTSKSGWPNV